MEFRNPTSMLFRKKRPALAGLFLLKPILETIGLWYLFFFYLFKMARITIMWLHEIDLRSLRHNTGRIY